MRQLLISSLLVIACFSGCVSGLDKAKQTVTVAEKVYAVGADELVSADKAMVAALQAKYDAGQITHDEADKQFSDWKVKRQKVALALNELKHAVSLAGLGISAVESGQVKDYSSVLVDLAKAVSEAVKALADAGVKLPVGGV